MYREQFACLLREKVVIHLRRLVEDVTDEGLDVTVVVREEECNASDGVAT